MAHDGSIKALIGYTKIGSIIIEDNVFIGARALIMPGVTIGENSIIAAGSVVTKSIPTGSIAAGNPAKVIANVDDYIEKNHILKSDAKIYDKRYTLAGNISYHDRNDMYEELKNEIGFVELEFIICKPCFLHEGDQMRVKNSIINISAGLANQLIITVLSFVSRTVFISSLGIEYLGVNALLTNILAMLTLAEAGIGASIMYSLYKPVAENDHVKINMLMNFYRKAYMVIAFIVLLLGLSIMPFLEYFIKDSGVEDVYVIYSIFLLNTVIPYLFVYKNSFLNVCQKGYIVTAIYSVSAIISTCLKIGILYYTKDYILYLLLESTITILTSVLLVIIVNKMYPFLKKKGSTRLDRKTKSAITKNVKAIVLQNIGNYLVFGTDNIIISSFVSIAAVGLYSNYNMLIEISRTFINQVFNNIYHSVGNLVANESIEKVYNIYKVYMFLNFWLYSFFTISLYILLEPFIILWLGSEFLMSENVLLILMILFYERGMRNSITTVKTTSGIFHEDRYAPLCQAAVNLIFSIILVQYIGIAGVFIGTLISAITVPFWTTPYLVYKKVFHKPVIHYFLRYSFYLAIGIGTYFTTKFICVFIPISDLLGLVLQGLICLIVPNLIYILIFYKTKEFKYLQGIVSNILRTVLNKFNVNKKLTIDEKT